MSVCARRKRREKKIEGREGEKERKGENVCVQKAKRRKKGKKGDTATRRKKGSKI